MIGPKPNSHFALWRWLITGSLRAVLLALTLAGCGREKTQLPDIPSYTDTPRIEITVSATATTLPTVTPTTPPTSTATRTITPTPTPSPSPTPTSRLPRNFVASTPADELSAYRLAPWTESDSIALAEAAHGWDMKIEMVPMPGNYHSSSLLFTAERLARFSTPLTWEEIAWAATELDPLGLSLPGMRTNQDLFMFLTERLLNQQGVKIEDLPSSLEKYWHLMSIPMQIANLYGDGIDGFVFEVRDRNYWSAVYAVRQVGDHYQLERLMNWTVDQGMFWSVSLTLKDVGDTNNNGYSEIALVIDSGTSGMPHNGSGNLELYEWNPSMHRFEVNSFNLYGTRCDISPCTGKWEFGSPNEYGNKPLIISHYTFTRGQSNAFSGRPYEDTCPYLEIQQTYLWDGVGYQLVNDIFLPPPAAPAKCQVDWAIAAGQSESIGWQNDEVMSVLSIALSDWPEDIDQDWGLATRDFVRLQTGIWYDLRGEQQTAFELLQPMINRPTNPDFPIFTQLAASYLQKRSEADVLSACVLIEDLWSNAIQDLPENTSGYLPVDIETVRNVWGFAPDRWYRRIENLCNLNQALEALSPLIETSNVPELKSWLARIGLEYNDFQIGDFNDDGQQDGLILWNLSNETYTFDISAYITSPQGMIYRYIAREEWVRDGELNLNWKAYHPAQDSPLVNILEFYGRLRAFVITHDYQVNYLLTEYSVDDFNIGDSLVIVDKNLTSGDQEIKSYVWDSQSSTFALVPGYDFDADLKEAKRLFLSEQDYPATIEFIERFLNEAPEEPRVVEHCTVDTCEYDPNWYRPSLQYLLAVAYELNGDPDKALEVYYHLWQEEPDNIFGMAASMKLELMGE